MPLLYRALLFTGCLFPLSLFAAPLPALVDAQWLARHGQQHVVLDVRSRAEYAQGHWPGARWAGFAALPWQRAYNGIPGYLPNDPELSKLLGGLGLNGSESVVVVGSAAQVARVAEAARVVWTLMVAGVQQVALLDGGAESLPSGNLERAAPAVSRATFRIRLQPQLLAEFDRVEGLLEDNGVVVDFRPTPYFEGERRAPQVAEGGTILDALGFPPDFLFNEHNGRFLDAQTLRKDFAHYGIPSKGDVVAFSDTGVWGALGWFALHRLLGNTRARLYDGSLVEWIDWGGEVFDSTDDMGGAIGG